MSPAMVFMSVTIALLAFAIVGFVIGYSLGAEAERTQQAYRDQRWSIERDGFGHRVRKPRPRPAPRPRRPLPGLPPLDPDA